MRKLFLWFYVHKTSGDYVAIRSVVITERSVIKSVSKTCFQSPNQINFEI